MANYYHSYAALGSFAAIFYSDLMPVIRHRTLRGEL